MIFIFLLRQGDERRLSRWGNIDEFILALNEDKIEIYPKVSRLSRLVDSVEVDELPNDWHELKRKIHNIDY